jgi:hypothetical protein
MCPLPLLYRSRSRPPRGEVVQRYEQGLTRRANQERAQPPPRWQPSPSAPSDRYRYWSRGWRRNRFCHFRTNSCRYSRPTPDSASAGEGATGTSAADPRAVAGGALGLEEGGIVARTRGTALDGSPSIDWLLFARDGRFARAGTCCRPFARVARGGAGNRGAIRESPRSQ